MKSIVFSRRIYIMIGLVGIIFGTVIALGNEAEDLSLSDKEAELRELFERRSYYIQKYLFHEAESSELLFRELAMIESYPLLGEDCRNAFFCRENDSDPVINLKLEAVHPVAATRDLEVYQVCVRWYLSGYQGYYSQQQWYRVRTRSCNGEIRLEEMVLLEDNC